MADTILVTYATDENNYKQVQQEVLDATGFLLYVGADYRLHAVATEESAATIDAAVPQYTLYQEPGGTMPTLSNDPIAVGYSTGDTLLDDTLDYFAKTWPEIWATLDPARVQGWVDEISTGSNSFNPDQEPRTTAELRQDILKYVITEQGVNDWVREQFDESGVMIEAHGETEDERLARITTELMTSERDFHEVANTISGLPPDPTQAAGTDADTTDVVPAPAPVGTTSEVPGIMGGGFLTKITRADQDDLWAMTYMNRGVSHIYTFDSYEAMVAALGADAVTSGTYGFQSMTEGEYDAGIKAGTIFDMDSATPLVGQSGLYGEWYSDIERGAAIAAGVRNPGAVGAYLSDPKIQALMAAAVTGDWSPTQLQAEIRNTNYYQNVMYPGIATLLDQGVDQPEAKWWQYHDSVEDNLAMLGYEKDDDGTYRSHIGNMMTQGISDTVFNTMAPQYHRAATSPEFAASLDYWLDKTAGRNVTFDDVFDAMSGQSEGDLAVAVESAVIQFQANLGKTTLSDEQISRIASMTELSEAQIATSFTTAEENLLALGDQGLKRYGLTEQALVSSAFGLKEGSQTAAEIQRLAAKTQRELGLQDDRKAQFYASFNERGSLIKPGLSALSPEAG